MRPELAPFVAEARTDALRRRHARVTAVHLLRALLASAPGKVRCAQLGLCTARVEERIDQLVAELPLLDYRGSAAPELEPRVIASLDAVRAHGFFRRWLQAPDLGDFVDAMIEDALLDAASLRFDPSPVEQFHEAVGAYAKRRGHRNLLVDHAFVVLLENDERLRAAVRLLGREPNSVRNKLAFQITGRRFRSLKLQALPGLVTLASMHANGGMQQQLTTNAVVSSLFKLDPIRRALTEANVDPFDLYFAWAHGVREEAIRVPDTAVVDIVIEDDAFSPFEAVVVFLREVFGILHDRAVRHAVETSNNGSSVVAVGLQRAEAELLLLTARRGRRACFLPLRVIAR